MGLNHRKNEHNLHTAIPLLDNVGQIEGWYKFDDAYLSPSVLYTSFPPSTKLTIGSRQLEIDRAVPVKVRLLEEDEDYHFWCKKKQHSQRINCGEYHKDFGDVEVGYSFSSPQTHIWFAGYAIHTECFENLYLSSHCASLRITPEHVIPPGHNGPAPGQFSLRDLPITKSLFQMVVEEGADFPIYATAVPKRVETSHGYITEMVPTAEFVNDCERDIIKREAYDVGVGISHASDPTQYPPTFPPVKPFEHPSLFWSFIHNELLKKRLARDVSSPLPHCGCTPPSMVVPLPVWLCSPLPVWLCS
ncbi:hypothetical protein GNI_117860 [Gregarina niphandrodes]|uniref:Uncharacterized protein n=1 Tax=Gregarina niphandrodes TaxID=110365 RepID=A0A023B2N8_GRENI|nr:hypothetical protein GNI_117860 [Gregarina niphandrodes]EZG55112.1 hypothetical protein GNI_117860 [Gregarina niphandrodes]|eukprot:XP_011131774.1 hypothetical protein GNI_117860 [Gregarina niphandrodes]